MLPGRRALACLLLLGAAAADERIRLTRDIAPGPGARQDAEADPGALQATGATARRLDESGGLDGMGDDGCSYVYVSGSNGQGSRHGMYERSGECEGQPYFSCIDCGSAQYIWYTGNAWYIGNAGCGGTSVAIYIIDAAGDLMGVHGDWTEYDGSWVANAAIAVTCEATLRTPEPCDYAIVSGSNGQITKHGIYQPDGTCASQPYYACLDCDSEQYIWYTANGYWYIGDAGCGSTFVSIYIADAAGDLAGIEGTWTEYDGGWVANPAIAVTCATTLPPTIAPTSLPPTLAPAPCDFAILSGSSGTSWTHGIYQESLCDDGTPLYTCLDCSSEAYIWYKSNDWYVGNGGCGSAYLNMYIDDVDQDLAAVSGTWNEYTGGGWSTDNEISVACYAAAGCQQVSGATDKWRCWDCSGASALETVGDGHCDAENNVAPCFDGGDCCEATCVGTCDTYDCADPDIPPVPDPYYADAAWYLAAIRAPEAWAAGYTGHGVQILVNDDGVDNTHPDLAKLDVANSCGVYAPYDSDKHGTNCAAIAAASSNSACGIGVAPDAGLAACVLGFTSNPAGGATEDTLTWRYDINHISSNSWGINRCEYTSASAEDCPFACPAANEYCPCDVCDGDDWASRDLSATCEQAVITYCTSFFNDDVTPCLELDHYFVKCGYGQLPASAHDSLVEATTYGRGGLGTVFVFAAGNTYEQGDDVNYKNYQKSRFTITVGAVHADLTHSDYSTSGAAIFISAPGGDGGNMAVAQPLANGDTDNCGDAGQGTSFAAPLVSGVCALVLEANPSLAWRDVQGLLAATAQHGFNDEDDEAGEWVTNGAGIRHSYKYGFGLVDALAAVTAAPSWDALGPEITLVTATTSGEALLDFDGAEHWVESTAAAFTSPGDFIVESVSVYVTIEHPRRGDLRIELERNGMTSLFTDDKLALGTRYTNWKYTTLRHWGETANQGAFTLRVADRRAGSGADDDHEPTTTYADDDGDDHGVLVSWTLQLYGHDADPSTPWTPQPSPRGGCDSVAVSGSVYQTSRHGTYLSIGRCEDKIYYECSDCGSPQKIWYAEDGYWAIGPDGCGTSSLGIYLVTDDDLAAVSGDWNEYGGGAWAANPDIAITCLTSPRPTSSPTKSSSSDESASVPPTARPTSRGNPSYSSGGSYSYSFNAGEQFCEQSGFSEEECMGYDSLECQCWWNDGQCSWADGSCGADDSCTPGWRAFDCLEDGTVMHGEGCSLCESCDLHDYTAATGGRVTCERDGHAYSYSYHPATYFLDEDLDGSVDEEFKFESCSYESCDDGGCARHGLGSEFAEARPDGSPCEPGCECCRADGGCGECAGDHVCDVDDAGYGTCTSCEDRFAGDDAVVGQCLANAGGGFEHEGTYYDNSCLLGDDCTPSWNVAECLDDGTLMHGSGCDSCDDCPMLDFTATTGGRYTCDPGTNTFYYDEDLDGTPEEEGTFEECWYDECDECDVTVSDDLDWVPDGTMAYGHSNGWCSSELDDRVGCAASPGECWEKCSDAYGDLVAIDWETNGDCYCQNACECMNDVSYNGTYLITRFDTDLPQECGGDEDEPTGYVMDDASLRSAVTLWFEDRAGAMTTYGPLATWNTSLVTDMSELFCASWCDYRNLGAASFDEKIGAWNTSRVTTMRNMFDGAAAFNRPLHRWNVARVSSTHSMFTGALAFNRPLDAWVVGAVTDMERMFAGAVAFDGPVGAWDVSKVTKMAKMFAAATSFNQPLDAWDVAAVEDLAWTFSRAAAFNQPLGSWAMHKVTSTAGMFKDALAFNQPLHAWPLDALTHMPYMFSGALAFDQDLGWCVDDHVRLQQAFAGTPCADNACGLVQAPGGCAPTQLPSAAPTLEPTRAPTLLPIPAPTTAAPTTAAPSPAPTLVPSPAPTTGAPSPQPTLVPTPAPTTPSPTPSPTSVPSPFPSPLPTPIQTVVQVASGVKLLGLDASSFNADVALKRAFALSILRTAPMLTEVTDIEAKGADRRRATEAWPPPGWTVRRLSLEKQLIITGATRRLDDGGGTGISYTGVARVDGYENAEAVAAGVLDDAADSLSAAVSDGSFLDTLKSAANDEAARRRLGALDDVSVDVNATLAEVAASEVAFFISTPVPTSAPTQVPTTPPSPAPSALPTTAQPTVAPSAAPSPGPTSKPSALPTPAPLPAPSAEPTARPTPKPTPAPTAIPGNPTGSPVLSPTPRPTPKPTTRPTPTPTPGPSHRPTPSPSTSTPSSVPTTAMPSAVPTPWPTATFIKGELSVAGISLAVALEYEAVFVVAIAALAGVADDRVAVLITAARRRLAVEVKAAMAAAATSHRGLEEWSDRRRLSGGVSVEYTITVDPATVTSAAASLSGATAADVDSEIATAAAATSTDSTTAFASVATTAITSEIVIESDAPAPTPANMTSIPRDASKPTIIYQLRKGIGSFWNATERVHQRIATKTQKAAAGRARDVSAAKGRVDDSQRKKDEAKTRATHGYARNRHGNLLGEDGRRAVRKKL